MLNVYLLYNLKIDEDVVNKLCHEDEEADPGTVLHAHNAGGGGVAGLLSGVGDTTLMAGETAIFFLGVQNSMGRQTLQLWLC